MESRVEVEFRTKLFHFVLGILSQPSLAIQPMKSTNNIYINFNISYNSQGGLIANALGSTIEGSSLLSYRLRSQQCHVRSSVTHYIHGNTTYANSAMNL